MQSKELVVIGLLFILLVSIFFWEVLVSPNGIIYSENSDIIKNRASHMYLTVEAIEDAGRVPLWNDYIFSGGPFIPNIISTVYFPFNIAFLLVGDWAFGFLYMLYVFLACLFMYMFLRLFFGKNASLIGAISYGFSSFIITNIYAGHVSVVPSVMFLPLIFFFFEHSRRTKKYFFSVACGIALALQFLTGQVQLSLYTISFLILFSLIKDIKFSVKSLAVALMVFLFLIPIQLFPSYSIIKDTNRAIGDYTFASSTSFPPVNLMGIFIPEFFGTPLYDSYIAPSKFWETSIYIGVLPLIFVLFAVLSKKDRYSWFFLLAALFSILFAFGKYTPVFSIFYKLGLNFFRAPARMLFFYIFSVCFLAGNGYQKLVDRKIQLKGIFIFLVLVLLLTFSFLGYAKTNEKGFVSYEKKIIEKVYNNYLGQASEKSLVLPIGVIFDRIGDVNKQVFMGMFIFVILLSLGILLIYLFNKALIGKQIFLWVMLLLVVCDMFIFGVKYIDIKDAEEVFDKLPVVDFLKGDKEDYRILVLDDSLPQHITERYGIKQVTGYEGVILKGYEEFINKIGECEFSSAIKTGLCFSKIKPNYLGLLNVKYIVTNRNFDLETKNLELVYDKEVRVYMNKLFLPKVFLIKENLDVGKIDSVEIADKILESTINKEVDYEVKYEPNKIIIAFWEIKNFDDGVLVISEIWSNGWAAYVGKDEIKIQKYGIVRAFSIREVLEDMEKNKTNELTMVYEPRFYKIGASISFIGLILSIVLLFVLKKNVGA